MFRAHEPLKSNIKSFQYSAVNEQERVADSLKENELFETDRFNRDMLVTNDVHRTPKKERWISPRGFTLPNKRGGDSVPMT